MANRVAGETSEMAFHKAPCYLLCWSTCTPTTSHSPSPPTVSSTPTICALPPNIIRSNRLSLPFTSGLIELHGRLLQGKPPAFKSSKDPANGVPYKVPPSRPQSGCHMGRYDAGTYYHICLPWHHTRPLIHTPKPLSQDVSKTLLPIHPPEKVAWDELGRVPPHHEDDGDITIYVSP